MTQRTITTEMEALQLDQGAIIRDAYEFIYERGDRWFEFMRMGSEFPSDSGDIEFPALVLWEPTK